MTGQACYEGYWSLVDVVVRSGQVPIDELAGCHYLNAPILGNSQQFSISSDNGTRIACYRTSEEFVIVWVGAYTIGQRNIGYDLGVPDDQFQDERRIHGGIACRQPMGDLLVIVRNLRRQRKFQVPVTPQFEYSTRRPAEEYR